MSGCFYCLSHQRRHWPPIATAGRDVWWERLVTLDLAHTLELGIGLKRPCRSLNQILVLLVKKLKKHIDVEV